VNKWSIPDILDKYSSSRRSPSRSPPAAAPDPGAAAAAPGPAPTRFCNVCINSLPETDFTAPKVGWTYLD
jgi:hypothetical protein